MAAEATTGSDLLITRRSFRSFVSEVFGPLLQVFLFVVGSALVLGGIVLLVAVILRGTREDIDLVQGTITILPQVMIDGLVRGFLYATIALGYTMVYGVLEFINFAHGEIFMVGAFVGAFFSAALASSGMLTTLSPILFVIAAVLLGMAVSGVLAMSIERVAYRPLRNAPRLVPLISAIGVSLVLQDVMRMIAVNTGLGFNAQFRTPDLGQPLVLAQMPIADERTIPVSIDSRSLIFIVVAILMLIGLNYLVNITKLGDGNPGLWRRTAGSQRDGDRCQPRDCDHVPDRGGAGGAAGILFGMRVGTINPYVGFLPGLKAFTAAVLGGIGNITGAMVGGIVLGFLEAFVASYLSLFTGGQFSGASYADIVAFSILILILIFRPSGLLGEAVTQKV
jgi:Branched-chain amino acid ABC-type transport system, permease components